MKTVSYIKLESEKEEFGAARFIMKVSVVLVAAFMLLNVLGIPTF